MDPREDPSRLASLDAFRGFAIASMMLVNNPGDWDHLYSPLAHAQWNGWTFTDTVFPFFLFAAGLAMALSLDRRRRVGADRVVLLGQLARRAAVIFAVGFALNLIPGFDFATVRIPGVLQRIALCILIAAPLVLFLGTRGLVAWSVALLAAYTIPMLFVAAPDANGVTVAGALEPGRDFGSFVDRTVLDGHLWSKSRTWDPEGLVSTLPAVSSLLFGVLAGKWLSTNHVPRLKTAGLALAGAACLALGVVLDSVLMPINKNLWTPSYCVFMTGWALVAFAAFHWSMDAAGSANLRVRMRAALLPLTIFGMNALFLFALSGVVARLLIVLKVKTPLYEPIRALPLAPETASLAFAIVFDLAMFAVAWLMWRQRWFVKA